MREQRWSGAAPRWCLLLCAFALACSPSPATPAAIDAGPEGQPATLPGAAPTSGQPPIVLIVVDTLRADLLSAYGYERPTSPHLEDFARTATTYRRAIAPAPWTLPSHASLFTGLYPFEHGARSYDPAIIGNTEANTLPLASRFMTLAEVLGKAGYRTGAFVANRGYLSPDFSLDQGFETYEVVEDVAAVVHARACSWLEASREPFFLFLNLMDVHRPYRCEPRPGFPEVGDPASSNELLKRLRLELLDGAGPPSDEDLERARQQYLNAIANVDAELGRLFDRLRSLDLFDEALIVITSDHGEFFGEHGLIEHGKDVYQEVLHIPLLVKAPGQASAHVDSDWVSLVHVAGLVLSQVDPARLPKRAKALTRHWPRAEVYAEKYYGALIDENLAEAPRLRRLRRAVYRGDAKYIDSADGFDELYDLARDPHEANNVRSGGSQSAELDALLGTLQPRPLRVAPSPKISEESKEALRALGYLEEQ